MMDIPPIIVNNQNVQRAQVADKDKKGRQNPGRENNEDNAGLEKKKDEAEKSQPKSTHLGSLDIEA